jgi:hypothetical protein
MDRTPRIYRASDRELPTALRESEDFRELNEKQARRYLERVRYIEEIVLKIQEWLSGRELDFRAFLDRIELDVAINQAAPPDNPDSSVSAWLFHSSWTFGTTPSQLRAQLSPSVLLKADLPPPTSDCSMTEFHTWMQSQSTGMAEALDGFFGAASFSVAIAYQIAMDVFLASIVVGVYRVRLNPKLLS